MKLFRIFKVSGKKKIEEFSDQSTGNLLSLFFLCARTISIMIASIFLIFFPSLKTKFQQEKNDK